MDEFNNRMDTQRQVLETVNRESRFTEELCGLSGKAIDRWLMVNRMEPKGAIATILLQISAKLFFLSTRSQEQVTEEYRLISHEVESLRKKLEEALIKHGIAA